MLSTRHLGPLLRATAFRPRAARISPAAAVARAGPVRRHHATAPLRRAYKDDQDRESLKPGRQETSKSGGDEEAAQSDAAFDPNKTSPEEAKDAAGAEAGGNPLEVSPANKDVSRPRGGEEEARGRADTPDKQRRSGPHIKA